MLKEWFKSNSQQGTKQDYVIKKQEQEICKINVKNIFIILTCANMNMKRT